MRCTSLTVLPLALALPASAQVRESWAANFDPGAQQETAYGNACDGARIAVTGRSYDPTSGFPPPPPTSDIETVVYDALGAQLWSRRFDGPLAGDDVGYEVALIPGGGVAVVGNCSGYSGVSYVTQRTVLVYSATGNLEYSRVTGNTTTGSFGRGLAIAANGDVILGGSDGANAGDLCVERLNAIGGTVWSTILDGGASGTDLVYDVKVGPSGDVFAAGYVGTVASGRDLVVMRLSGSTGALQWIETLDGGASQDDYALRIAVDSFGRSFVAGVATEFGTGQDALVLGVSASGSPLWSATFDGGSNSLDSARRVVVDPFGRVVVGGILVAPTTSRDFGAWRFDAAAGTVLWSATWNGQYGGDDDMRGMDVDGAGNVTIAGSSRGVGGSTDSDIMLASWDSQGILAWTHRDDGAGSGAQYASSVAVTTSLIAVSGSADAVPTGPLDYRTVVLERTATPFCLGDGTGPCPCSNASASPEQAGCAHSFGIGGRVRAQGSSSLSADTLVLLGSAMPNSSCLYFQGTTNVGGGLGSAFGDGVRCAGGTVIRLGTKTNVLGVSQYPALGDATVSVRGLVGAPGTRTYQAWYRNSASFCTVSTFNLSNGLVVTWSM